jgi:hypothetical protein
VTTGHSRHQVFHKNIYPHDLNHAINDHQPFMGLPTNNHANKQV